MPLTPRDRIALSAGLGGFGLTALLFLALAVGLVLNHGGAGCSFPLAQHATAATYVYEKDDGSVPSGVEVALDKLNKAGLIANAVDQDIVNGAGEIPTQYRVAIPAAKSAGLPSLVYHTADKALTVVKNPKTEADVLEHKP